MVNDLILLVLLSWGIPLMLAVFYHLTEPVPGRKRLRRPVSPRSLAPVSRILVAQKVTLIFIVSFIAIVRFTGGFPGREWVAFGLYILLVAVAWAMFVYQRHVQLPFERDTRAAPISPQDGGIPISGGPMKLYAKSLLYVLLAVAGVLVTAMADDVVTTPELVNVAIIGVGAVGVYLVPNLPTGVAQYGKTGVAFLAAALVALTSALTDGITASEWLQIAIAAFAGVGVYIVPNEAAAPAPLDTPVIRHPGAHNIQ